MPSAQWHQVDDIPAITERARDAAAEGADLVFAWGGDGTVRSCIEGLVHTSTALAILPAGTGNLLAANLGIPTDARAAVRIGLHGARIAMDTGLVNGERFAVMAGAGFDALMIRGATSRLKSRIGRAAYFWSGLRSLNVPAVRAGIDVDGERFFWGCSSCVLMGNVGKLVAGIGLFTKSRPDDGILELGVSTAKGHVQWIRTVGRVASGKPEASSFVDMTQGRRFEISFEQPVPYQLDGDSRPPASRIDVRVDPASVIVCMPPSSPVSGAAVIPREDGRP